MTNEEKEMHPYHEIVGGFLRINDYKESIQKKYNKATEEEKRSIEYLPNYDPDVLLELFGIYRRKH